MKSGGAYRNNNPSEGRWLMDKSKTFEEQLQEAFRKYGSDDLIARVLQRGHPIFYKTTRQTVYRWRRRKRKNAGSGLQGKMALVLEILNSHRPPKTGDPCFERLQKLHIHLGELRREVKEILKDFRASQRG